MRKRYIYDKQGNATEITDGYAISIRAHEIMPDIGRFRSMVDGSVIEGRKQYEEHLKRHHMRIVDPSEVSKEKILSYQKNYDVAPEHRKEIIRSQIDSMTHKEFKAALRRDIDAIKWKSNY